MNRNRGSQCFGGRGRVVRAAYVAFLLLAMVGIVGTGCTSHTDFDDASDPGDQVDVGQGKSALTQGGDTDPLDLDGDGFLNEDDNCPDVANPDQTDFDWDRIGDACDTCPKDYDNNLDSSCLRTWFFEQWSLIT